MQFLIDNFAALTITGITLGAVYALIALGYTLVYGVLRLINFAHSEVFMFGTFAALWVVMLLGGKAGGSVGQVVFWIAMMFIAAMAMSGLIAVLLERVAYRPLRKRNAPPLVALISAIGASFVLSEAMGLREKIAGWVGLDDELRSYVRNSRNAVGLPDIMRKEPLFNIGGYNVTNVDILVILGAVAVMIVLDQFVKRSRLGRGIRAVAQDPEAAALMGVNRDRVIQVTFLVGGVMAGAAAVFYLLRIGITRYDVGFILGVKAFTAAVLGGIGNLRGALLGGFILGLAENYGSAIVGTQWKDVVAFVLLVVILLFRPTGLLGESLGKARA
ncbi:branched-chain amino acid ABC transporter permease [Terracoccus luteus]|jgi:branched-chain amino acid transport system permease protein|uniref:Branched-chain amino acid transport system permease protein n=1 Tax=Terracoccus luteus TaxID=53356 RepID=A0A839PYK1_9MICO|nr:branched-chain amino acid ABC transporter permease [Terracoccus luteus]MBB2987784.1 branched-chain amino acid transport system permease protein [Terracoccus luteus]MCP2173435.1 branched-chain amino acid transport system permease protein [Terracoccus luteus]